MVTLYITIGILSLITLYLLFRVLTLTEVLKKEYRQRVDNFNKINAFLFPVFFIILFGCIWYFSPILAKSFLPESASEHGVVTDRLFWSNIVIICIASFITHILLFYFPYKYQFNEKRRANFYPENHKLEYIWTIIPAIVLSILIFTGWRSWSKITSDPPKDAVVLEIMGKQFAWQVRYPGKDGKLGTYNFRKIKAGNDFGMDLEDKDNFDNFIPTEIHIPKGKPVVFKIRARDVLHSVFLPHFRQKMDAVPGMPTSFWIVPKYTTAEMREITGNPDFKYELACTEICGRGHFAMRFLVVVDEPEEFEKWYNEQESWLVQNPDLIEEIKPELRKFIPGYGIDKNTTNINENEVVAKL